MPEDLGKDINGVDRLKRLHETFEADLAPLEKQVSCFLLKTLLYLGIIIYFANGILFVLFR